MISVELRGAVDQHGLHEWSKLTVDSWLSGVVIHVLEITHGQWIYQNLVVHNRVAGTLITKNKKDLMVMAEILQHIESGGNGLDQEGMGMAEEKLEGLNTTSGENGYYWL